MMKKNIFILVFCCFFCFSSCGVLKKQIAVSDTKNVLKHENAEEKGKFALSTDLKAAILPLALSLESFDSDTVKEKDWKDFFISHYILNSRNSCGYLNQISDKNNGNISVRDLEYIHESLTGVKLDFFGYSDINTKDSSSFLSFGEISGCMYEELPDGNVELKADMEKGWDGTDAKEKYSLYCLLTKNPDSCFDGYSIVKLTCEELPSTPLKSGEKTFVGTVWEESEWTDENTCTVEFSYDEEEIGYAHFVYLDVSENEKLREKLRKLVGSEVKITYVEGSLEHNMITKVTPVGAERN